MLKAHMICHTHWDREWYLTKEQFRTKLVRLIDGLLDIIDTQPEFVSFMLDGQTIAIEDYLEIKPYNKERFFNALGSGKIVCGPWYILPDELLISGESHIRNYLIGKKSFTGYRKSYDCRIFARFIRSSKPNASNNIGARHGNYGVLAGSFKGS